MVKPPNCCIAPLRSGIGWKFAKFTIVQLTWANKIDCRSCLVHNTGLLASPVEQQCTVKPQAWHSLNCHARCLFAQLAYSKCHTYSSRCLFWLLVLKAVHSNVSTPVEILSPEIVTSVRPSVRPCVCVCVTYIFFCSFKITVHALSQEALQNVTNTSSTR